MSPRHQMEFNFYRQGKLYDTVRKIGSWVEPLSWASIAMVATAMSIEAKYGEPISDFLQYLKDYF